MKTIEKKFKVWDKENQRFVTYISHIVIDANGYVYNLQDGDGGSERYTLFQYAGLKDKNNKEIYEGDKISGKLTIEEDNYDFEGIVEFEDGKFYCEQADFELYTYILKLL